MCNSVCLYEIQCVYEMRQFSVLVRNGTECRQDKDNSPTVSVEETMANKDNVEFGVCMAPNYSTVAITKEDLSTHSGCKTTLEIIEGESCVSESGMQSSSSVLSHTVSSLSLILLKQVQ